MMKINLPDRLGMDASTHTQDFKIVLFQNNRIKSGVYSQIQ